MAIDIVSSQTYHNGDVIVAPSPGRGRGVFARRRFEPNEIIEICPMIALAEGDVDKLNETGLYDYYFGWGKDGKQAAIALGYGSLYNHSFTPNAAHHKNAANDTMSIVAVRQIAAGEEILICYQTGMQKEQPAMWFDVR
jgi:uncharacterized protein